MCSELNVRLELRNVRLEVRNVELELRNVRLELRNVRLELRCGVQQNSEHECLYSQD